MGLRARGWGGERVDVGSYDEKHQRQHTKKIFKKKLIFFFCENVLSAILKCD